MVRHVKTAAGVETFGEPIGSVIVDHPGVKLTPKKGKVAAPKAAFTKAELHGAQPTLDKLQGAPSGMHVSFQTPDGTQHTFGKNHAGNWVNLKTKKEFTSEELAKSANADDADMSMLHIKTKGPFDSSSDPIIATAKKAKAAKVVEKAKVATPEPTPDAAKQTVDDIKASLVKTAHGAKLDKSNNTPDLEPWTNHPSFGGSHEIRYFQDKNSGKKYIAKSAGNEKLASIEDAASGIGALYGFGTPKSYLMTTPDGVVSHVQEVLDHNGTDFRLMAENGNLHTLSTDQLTQLMTQQVLDWLISNTDAHGDNFLKTPHGIIGIDKGQAWKNFGTDKLSADYQHYSGIKDKPLYNFFFDEVKSGKITPEQYDEISAAVIKKASQITNDSSADENKFKGFVKQAVPDNPTKRLDILYRKDNLKSDFQKLYADNKPNAAPTHELSSAKFTAGQELHSSAEMDAAPVGTVIQPYYKGTPDGVSSQANYTKLENGKWVGGAQHSGEPMSSDLFGFSKYAGWGVLSVGDGKAGAPSAPNDSTMPIIGDGLSHDDLEKLPDGTIISDSADSLYTKKDGQWHIGTGYTSYGYPSSTFGKYETKLVELPGKPNTPNVDTSEKTSTSSTPSWITFNAGDNVPDTMLKDLPAGTTIQDYGTKYTKTQFGLWQSENGGTPYFPYSFKGATSLTFVSSPGNSDMPKVGDDASPKILDALPIGSQIFVGNSKQPQYEKASNGQWAAIGPTGKLYKTTHPSVSFEGLDYKVYAIGDGTGGVVAANHGVAATPKMEKAAESYSVTTGAEWAKLTPGSKIHFSNGENMIVQDDGLVKNLTYPDDPPHPPDYYGGLTATVTPPGAGAESKWKPKQKLASPAELDQLPVGTSIYSSVSGGENIDKDLHGFLYVKNEDGTWTPPSGGGKFDSSMFGFDGTHTSWHVKSVGAGPAKTAAAATGSPQVGDEAEGIADKLPIGSQVVNKHYSDNILTKDAENSWVDSAGKKYGVDKDIYSNFKVHSIGDGSKPESPAVKALKQAQAKHALVKANHETTAEVLAELHHKHEGKNPADLTAGELRELATEKSAHEANIKALAESKKKLAIATLHAKAQEDQDAEANAAAAQKIMQAHGLVAKAKAAQVEEAPPSKFGPNVTMETLQATKAEAQANRKNANIAREHFIEEHPVRGNWTAADKAEYAQLSLASKNAQTAYLQTKQDIEDFGKELAAKSGVNNKSSGTYATIPEGSFKQLTGEEWGAALERGPKFDKDILYDYSGSFADSVNSALWHDMQFGTDNAEKKYGSQLERMDDSFSEIKQDSILYRGTSAVNGKTSLEDISKFLGTEVPLPAYTSTAYDTTGAFSGNVQLKLQIPGNSGVKAAYLKDISSHKGENEVLLQRGLVIIPVDVRLRNSYPGDTMVIVTGIVQLAEEPDD